MVTAGPAFPGPIFLESNRVGRRICGTARNASHALKRAGDGRNMQELDRAFLLAALDGLNTNIYITDTVTNRIVYANENMKRIFGLEEPEGRICWEVLQDGMDGICPFCRIRRLQAMGGEQSCVWDEMNTLTGRTYKNFDCLIRWEGRDYYVQNSIDVTEYRKLTEEAGLDELTQMMNRRAGKAMMETALKAAREAKRQMAVVLLDINELKRINDLYGHSEGDRLLQYVSAVLQPRLRTGDLMFRLSGDEFVLILSGEDKNSAAQRIAQAQKAIADQREQNGIFYEASFSFGVAEAYPEDRCTVDELISQADRLMYLNKRDYHIRRARERLQENGSRSGGSGTVRVRQGPSVRRPQRGDGRLSFYRQPEDWLLPLFAPYGGGVWAARGGGGECRRFLGEYHPPGRRTVFSGEQPGDRGRTGGVSQHRVPGQKRAWILDLAALPGKDDAG